MFTLHRKAWLAGLLVAATCVAGAVQAQTTTMTTADVKHFEILAVDGNYVVVRDQKGTRELRVPSDFRFAIDGKSLGVADLKPGMKGTAVVTKTTTTRQVVVTEVKNGTVIGQSGRSLVVKEDTGKIHRFSQSGIDDRGVQLFMGDKPVRVFNLEPGDKISARIVTAGAPDVLTQTQVDAELAKAPPPAPAAAPAVELAAAPEAASAEAAPVEAAPVEAAPMEAEPTPEAAPAATDEAAAPAPPQPYFKNPFFMLLALIIIAALIWVLMRRRVKK